MKRLIPTLAIVLAAALTAVFFSKAKPAASKARLANQPKVPGTLRLTARERREEPKGIVKAVERTLDWKVSETAIIVCDMWDDHHCKIAAQRVGVMAPRMNQALTAALAVRSMRLCRSRK